MAEALRIRPVRKHRGFDQCDEYFKCLYCGADVGGRITIGKSAEDFSYQTDDFCFECGWPVFFE